MARAKLFLQDFLQNFRFHLFDMFFMTPSGSVKFPIFTPLAGFNSITTPEIEQEFEEIREGNSKYIKYFPLNKVSISPIIIIRGVSVFEYAFYRWIKKGITFDDPRRHLLLVSGSMSMLFSFIIYVLSPIPSLLTSITS